MKILKKILLGAFIFLALVLIVAAFAPKDFKSEREIVINKPRTEVFEYIRLVKNQDHFGVWQLADPQMKKSYEGTDGTVGFRYSWDSKKMGKGTQTITHITAGERMDTELNFGWGDPAKAYFITQDAGTNQTRVTWGITGRSPYPFNIMGLFFDMGHDFEKGLQNLKQELEK
ncbi:MAG TPA: SRPBCC family protein [Flavipsychrobacter sp.]|nr:SRPBCC family protein [Flavipsychrobacter sp.]